MARDWQVKLLNDLIRKMDADFLGGDNMGCGDNTTKAPVKDAVYNSAYPPSAGLNSAGRQQEQQRQAASGVSSMSVVDTRVDSPRQAGSYPPGFYMGQIGPFTGLFIRSRDAVVYVNDLSIQWSLAVAVSTWQRVHGTIRVERNA